MLSSFGSWPGALINPQWLEVPMSRTHFYVQNDIRAIKVNTLLHMGKCSKRQTNDVYFFFPENKIRQF